MQVVRVSIAGASFAEVVSLIGPHHDLVSSITRGDDEWTVTFRQCASIEFIVNGLLERAATEFGLVAGHRGLEDETPMEPWEAHDAVCNGDVEVGRNNNTHQQTLLWLERVRDADKVAELIEALNKESR